MVRKPHESRAEHKRAGHKGGMKTKAEHKERGGKRPAGGHAAEHKMAEVHVHHHHHHHTGGAKK
jgi:hypothetical protein